MDSYERNLLNAILDLLHKLVGYADAKEDYRPILQFVPPTDPPETKTPDVGTSDENQERGFFEYTQKEIQKMPKKIQGLMLVDRKRCHFRRKKIGDNKYTYEVRFRAGGYNLSACGKTKELAKENMRRKLMAAPSLPTDPAEPSAVPDTFDAFTMYYFENFRKEKVAPLTYKLDLHRYKRCLLPTFGDRRIAQILPADCKKLIDEIRAEGKSKTADDVYSLLSIIFKGAIAHGIIDRNPMATVFHHKHERQNGSALSRIEEEKLLEATHGTVYQHGVALTLFCGLRPGELKSAVWDGDFIKTVNSKRKTKKTEYKRIYVCDRLRALLPADGSKPYICDLNKLRAKIRDVVPGHRLYDLRITFNTRCKELDVSDHARAHFMGHSLGAIGNAYTDLSDDYLRKEGKKLNMW